MYNTSNNTLLLNFEKVEFKTKPDVEAFKQQVTSYLDTIYKKVGKVNCVVNYKDINLNPELLEAFADMCFLNSDKYFVNQTRYIPKETQVLKEVLSKKNIGDCYDEVIGDYVLKEKIGEGSFGVVRLATSLQTGSQVAVKILCKSEMDEDYQGFEHLKGLETKIHSTLNHPNIVQLLRLIETEDYIYMVMEYCSGGKLEKFLEYQHFSEDKARRYFKNLVNAVEYIHSKNISHRDIHPGNFILDEKKDQVKLIDFGLSNYYSMDYKITFRCGRAMYAAPEMLNGSGYYGPEVDIWALGVCLFVMLTGFVPFRFTANTINREFSFPLEDEGLSHEAVDLIYKILALNPQERLSLQDIKQHPWMKM